ncbi:hypothetical protein [Stutzerimonas stutzeri]|uniref:hypothetical protein n=1 Tax=Stutzerimonas stutzeri TaxID=316 RepID=UPI0012D37F9E|nr:hypothetical protein [Stutzerimonas stutzeri]
MQSKVVISYGHHLLALGAAAMKEGVSNALAVVGAVAMLALGVTQLIVASMWMDEVAGIYWTIAALIAVFMFRLTLFVVIGAFLGAYQVLDWHWAAAGLFAMPTLALIVPGAIAMLFSALAGRRQSGA